MIFLMLENSVVHQTFSKEETVPVTLKPGANFARYRLNELPGLNLITVGLADGQGAVLDEHAYIHIQAGIKRMPIPEDWKSAPIPVSIMKNAYNEST